MINGNDITPYWEFTMTTGNDITPYWGEFTMTTDNDITPYWGEFTMIPGNDITPYWGEFTMISGNDITPYWGEFTMILAMTSPFIEENLQWSLPSPKVEFCHRFPSCRGLQSNHCLLAPATFHYGIKKSEKILRMIINNCSLTLQQLR